MSRFKSLSGLWVASLLVLTAFPAVWAQGRSEAPQMVTGRLSFETLGLGARVEVYEVARGARVRVWKTGVAADIDGLPLGAKVENTFRMRKGGMKRFVLVLRNHGKQPLYFFAAPHQVLPPQQGIGFRFKCLCVSQVFKVPPNWVWYRVIALKLFRSFRGGPIELRHTLVRIGAREANRIMR